MPQVLATRFASNVEHHERDPSEGTQGMANVGNRFPHPVSPLTSEMKWNGSKGDWRVTAKWRGGTDAAGRPQGLGVLTWPENDHPNDFAEGAMVAGNMQGQWVVKYKDGTWFSSLFKDDVYRDCTVSFAPTPSSDGLRSLGLFYLGDPNLRVREWAVWTGAGVGSAESGPACR